VLVEILAAALDLLSDKLDRVSSEATLETARRPESVRRLLSMIGFDAARAAWDPTVDPSTPREIADQFGVILVDPAVDRDGANAALERLWERSPRLMDRARTEGPRRIRTNRRMVTIKDHADRLEDHPLVARASARARFTGSWTTISIALVTTGAIRIPGADPARARRRVGVDDAGVDYAPVADDVRRFHAGLGLPDPPIGEPPVTAPTVRTVLRPYLEAFRMAGQHVVLEDAVPVPVTLALSIRVASNHFRSEVRRAVETALGTVDILDNNAGGLGWRKPFEEMTEAEFDHVVRLNLYSVVFCTRRAKGSTKAKGAGRIINISTSAARGGGNPGIGAYATAKAGVSTLTRSLAKELAPHGVTVNGVAPGVIRTKVHAPTPPEVFERIVAGIPLGRAGEPSDVAGPVLLLASAEGGYITGEIIEVNGGLVMD